MQKIDSFIWYEKHRPSKLKDLSLKKEHQKIFKKFLKDKEIPHLIFAGGAGSGKSTLSNIIINTIPSVVMRLNASGKEDRSIETMQTKVRQFAKTRPPKGKLKIVSLEEASGMLGPAQESLKDTIEANSDTCRFIMTCNHLDKIIDPIKSRCLIFKFEQFPKKKLLTLCENILKKENVSYTKGDVEKLIDIFYPDIRSVINNLQGASFSGSFDLDTIGSLGVDPISVMDALLKGQVLSIRKLIAGATDYLYLYKYIFNEFIRNNGSQEEKAEMSLAVAESLSMDNQVPDREINFVACCLLIMGILDIKPNFAK